jgi:hypothetical protein
VNVVSENDLELLEEYLDEALGPVESERVRIRVLEDPAFAAALEQLRAERNTRAAVWASLEPSDRAVREVTRRVLAETRRSHVWLQVSQFARFGSAAAACLLIGLFMGWMGRERGGPGMAFLETGVAPVSQVSDGPRVSPSQVAMPGVVMNEIRDEAPNQDPIQMLLVREVSKDLGLRRGDLVLSVDGEPVRDFRSFLNELSRRPGKRNLSVLRGETVGNIVINVNP